VVRILAILLTLKLQEEARERDQILREHWIVKVSQWRADQLIFLDESGMNSKLGRRKKGWGPKGKRVISKVPTQKAENLSFLPAITVDGYMTCIVFCGAINAEIFEEFIEHDVLPHCNPYPGPKSVIVMDNAGIHIPEVPKMCEL